MFRRKGDLKAIVLRNNECPLLYSLDKTGQYRDRLLEKLKEALTGLTQRYQQEYLLLINLVSRRASGGGDKMAVNGEKEEKD